MRRVFRFLIRDVDARSNFTLDAKQALLHPYITGEPFDAKNPFKPPSCMETTSEETRKEHNGAAKMALQFRRAQREKLPRRRNRSKPSKRRFQISYHRLWSNNRFPPALLRMQPLLFPRCQQQFRRNSNNRLSAV